MSTQWHAAWQLLPEYLGEHVVLSAAALLLGVLISLPLTIVAVRRPRVRWSILAFASVIQTIPSLALLALFYPLLLAVSSLTTHVFGFGFRALGFLPSLLALTLYSMLPIIRNGVAGIANLPAPIIEAAQGVGMTDWQRLIRIELPLATPMLMAGVRTAAVWVIGAATLSTPVGQTSLGNYIFSGLQVEDWVSVLFGCVSAAALALLVDQLLGVIEHATVKRRNRGRIVAAGGVLIAGVVAAMSLQLATPASTYVLGAKNFSEQYILAELMARRIEHEGAQAVQRTGLGSVVAFRALARNDIDAYVEYSGTLWATVLRRTDTPPREVLMHELSEWLREQHGIAMLGSLGFENAYALAMRRQRAEELNIRSIDDLAQHASQLTIGSDLEFFQRPEWTALERAYGLRFAGRRQYQPTFMYRAIASGEVDVISAFSSDGRIARDDLVILSDPRQAILPYDAVILLAPSRANDTSLRSALEPLVGTIPVQTMQQANLLVDREQDKFTPAAAARWLEERR